MLPLLLISMIELSESDEVEDFSSVDCLTFCQSRQLRWTKY